MDEKMPFAAVRDGKLHLAAFLGDRFVYLVEDVGGSHVLINDMLADKFPTLVRRMLRDAESLKAR